VKFLTIFLFGSILAVKGYSQTREIDSLRKNLENFKTPDSSRAQLLFDIAVKLRRADPSEAIWFYQESFSLAEKVNEPIIHVMANNGMAICYGMLGEYPLAIEHFHKTIELGKKYKNFARIADGYNGLGIIYKRLGDYPQSLEYYSHSLPLYDSIDDQMGVAAANENLGILYDLMKDPRKSMEYYQRAIDIYKKENRPLLVSTAKANVGILYLSENRYEEALNIFRQALRTYDSLQRFANSVNIMADIGHVYLKQKKYREAEEILMRSLTKAKELSLKQEQATIYENLFEIAMARNNFDVALSFANEFEKLCKALDSKQLLSAAYSMLSRVHEKRGDYVQSLNSHKKYKAWTDSVYNEDNAKAFKAQEVKVEVLQKNKQLAEQNLRLGLLQERVYQETRLKWVLAITSILLFATGFLFYQKFTDRKRVNELLTRKNAEISKQKAHIELMNYQLENRMLRAQINPHFIFNSLGSIQHLITSDQKAAALKYLVKFSNLLRQVLETSITGNAVLKDELQLLNMYLELEALRFDNSFTYVTNVDETLNEDAIEIPTMILQPLIENAVLHGLMPKTGDRKLTISFASKETTLVINIEDNGIGRDASRDLQKGKLSTNPSRGLSVTRQRLASLSEKQGWQSELDYVDLVDANGGATGTRVTLKLPIREII
jgi:tetratricopeptide (TPR) repeat protein